MLNLNASSKVLLCFMYNILCSGTFSFNYFDKVINCCLVKIIDRDIQHYKFFLIAGIVLITYLIPQSREYWKACFLIKSQTTYSNINLSAQFLPPLIPTVFFSFPTSLFKTLEITFLHIYFSDHNSMSLLQDWLP